MIIGVVGYNCSGKDTVAQILEKQGFIHFSLSDIIRDEIRKEGKEITRQYLIEKGNWLRKEYGSSVLAEKALQKIKEYKEKGYKNFTITSIRNPYEVKILRKQKDFILLYINATPEKRFERLCLRKRANFAKTFEEFRILEERERKSSDKTKQSIDDCISMAEYKIDNNNTVQELETKIKIFINNIN